jgi:hypothetical protein
MERALLHLRRPGMHHEMTVHLGCARQPSQVFTDWWQTKFWDIFCSKLFEFQFKLVQLTPEFNEMPKSFCSYFSCMASSIAEDGFVAAWTITAWFLHC